MKDIKILIACHKPAELPNNDLFLPIQVGAKNAKKRMRMQQDDEGENISDKNPTYCELTAQYWAWKNLKADYCGLCHYRRFLCFKPTTAKRNNRNQIEASVMNAHNIRRFGLEDDRQMREIIEANDVVVGEEQLVNRLYTPRGAKSTAYEHWAAHDRALVMKKDLDTMMDILDEVAPEVGSAAREYMSGKTFLGFNCFVMKKELFDQLCEIEFRVLEELEARVNLEHYSQQLTRIYGFMGEIICSSFIYYLQRSGQYRIARVPILYFNYTEPLENFKPLYPLDADHVPLIFDYNDSDPMRIGPVWQSFLEHVNDKTLYDVLIISDLNSYTQGVIEKMATEKSNIKVRFVPALPIRELIIDRYGFIDETDREVMKRQKNPENDQWHLSILPYLPFVLSGYEKALIIDKNTIFCDDIAKMWREYYQAEQMIVAPHNAFIVSRINDIYYETLERHLSEALKDPYQYFSTSAFIWDFAEYRRVQKDTTIKDLYDIPNEPKQTRAKEEILNILCEGKVKFADMRWGVWLDSDILLEHRLPHMPLKMYQALQKARQDIGMIVYLPQDPWEKDISEFTELYWQTARQTVFYEYLMQCGMSLTYYRAKTNKKEVLTKVFPVDSGMRARLTKVLPYGSKRNNAVKKVLGLLKLR